MGFIFDIFQTKLFEVPILPVPMRIDRVINGFPAFIISPETNILKQIFSEYNVRIIFSKFYLYGFTNYIRFANQKSMEIINKPLDSNNIIKWFDQVKENNAHIPDLEEDFTKLISFFIEYVFAQNKKSPIIEKSLIVDYLEKSLHHLRNRLESNQIKVFQNDNIIPNKIYLKKKGKIFPNVIPIDIMDNNNHKKPKKVERAFVPYLIYDDLIDCFAYNLKILNDSPQNLYDFSLWNKLGIVTNENKDEDLEGWKDLLNLDIKPILQMLEQEREKIPYAKNSVESPR